MGREGHPVRALVTGAGGFIGNHLVAWLRDRGYYVRGVDIKEPEFNPALSDEFVVGDLRNPEIAMNVCRGMDEVYNLAADMGGIGYITSNFADISRNNVLINVNMLDAAVASGVKRFFYSSSACVYPGFLQEAPEVTPLKEVQAIPADPEKGYGWEKLFSEQLCQYYYEDHGLETRVARFHNVYGPYGTYDGGKEKAPAALCRKVALAPDGGEIEIWGDGKQTRSFLYIGDVLDGICTLMRSDIRQPVNLGDDRMVSVDELADIIIDISGKKISKRHDLSKPQGVRGRNSDNSFVKDVLNWEPYISLEMGLAATYDWIQERVR